MSDKIHAELFIATGCAHCPSLMEILSKQVKDGNLSSLSITNISVDTETAEKLNIRSVPWLKLGSFILPGKSTPSEIEKWITLAKTDNGIQEYVKEFLVAGQLPLVIQAVSLSPETLPVIIELLHDEDTDMQTRIGIDALLENFSGEKILEPAIPVLIELLNSNNIRFQIDALHYLALAATPEVKQHIQFYSDHPDKQLKAASLEALETLSELTS